MTENNICEIFALYGVDVILLAAVTAALCEALKRTVLKDNARAVMLIAYGAGIIFYSVYACVHEMSAAYLLQNFAAVCERGLSVGTLALLICAGVDKFLGGGTNGADGGEPTEDSGEETEKTEQAF